MSVLLTIIAVIVIFSVLVLIHEYGHFLAARRAGIKVLEFGIGFPPRLFSKKYGETLYSVNAIPFGGFVRLFGEDAVSEEILKNKRSYAHKSPWVRIKVVVAGVFMNFVLAIVLLTIGFSFGIEPLLVTEQDLFQHLEAGNVKSEPGIFVGKVSDSAKTLGVAPGDKLLAIDDKPITENSQLAASKDIDITLVSLKGETKKIHLPLVSKDRFFGIDFKPFTEFPRLVILEVKPDSASIRAGLKSGDVILQVNGSETYFPEDFETVISQSNEARFRVMRGNQILEISVSLPDQKRVVIADVFENSAAQQARFEKGDIVLSMDGAAIAKPEQIQEMLRKNPGKEMVYRISRRGTEIQIKAKAGAKNILGIALSTVSSFRNSEVSVYRGSILTSITEIKKVRYAPWKAFKQAISESVRLTGLTVSAFGRTLKSIVSQFTVPAEIGGPVQIAYYTHTFVQEGFFALLRFTALLSLSLAVINVLPIPALDGGRLLFIAIEVIFKKRVNARFESMVHSIGFVLLLLLIVLITYSDITKLF
ncbi:RIP metalloprotease RseP [Candidatus Peregrinibacteria bacterium]|nr:RIP metalloprotease RseP [Candidatus Peregrinibacteria bacterium]